MTLISPQWGDTFVNKEGVPNPRQQRWIDEVSRIVNTNNSSVTDRLDAIEDFLFKVIQFINEDYLLLTGDSGAIADTSLKSLEVTFPLASEWVDQNKFIENAGGNQVKCIPQTNETISGVDLLVLDSGTLNPVINVKSNGQNLTLLSDRNGSDVIGAVYWTDQIGDRITDQSGEEIFFYV